VSNIQYATHQPHRTWIRARNGSTHSTYCGECTLLSTRNAHTMLPLTCTHGYASSRRHQPTASATTQVSTINNGVSTFS